MSRVIVFAVGALGAALGLWGTALVWPPVPAPQNRLFFQGSGKEMALVGTLPALRCENNAWRIRPEKLFIQTKSNGITYNDEVHYITFKAKTGALELNVQTKETHSLCTNIVTIPIQPVDEKANHDLDQLVKGDMKELRVEITRTDEVKDGIEFLKYFQAAPFKCSAKQWERIQKTMECTNKKSVWIVETPNLNFAISRQCENKRHVIRLEDEYNPWDITEPIKDQIIKRGSVYAVREKVGPVVYFEFQGEKDTFLLGYPATFEKTSEYSSLNNFKDWSSNLIPGYSGSGRQGFFEGKTKDKYMFWETLWMDEEWFKVLEKPCFINVPEGKIWFDKCDAGSIMMKNSVFFMDQPLTAHRMQLDNDRVIFSFKDAKDNMVRFIYPTISADDVILTPEWTNMLNFAGSAQLPMAEFKLVNGDYVSKEKIPVGEYTRHFLNYRCTPHGTSAYIPPTFTDFKYTIPPFSCENHKWVSVNIQEISDTWNCKRVELATGDSPRMLFWSFKECKWEGITVRQFISIGKTTHPALRAILDSTTSTIDMHKYMWINEDNEREKMFKEELACTEDDWQHLQHLTACA